MLKDTKIKFELVHILNQMRQEGIMGKREAEMTNIEADLLIAQAEIKSLKGKIEKLKTAVKVFDDICKNGCSWK